RLVETARTLMTGRTAIASLLTAGARRKDAHDHAHGSVLFPDSQYDLSAELLHRGLARLDLTEGKLLAQQPALVKAARAGLRFAAQQPAIADASYREA